MLYPMTVRIAGTLMLAVLLSPASLGAQEAVGYVAEVHGRWRLVGTSVDSLTVGHLLLSRAVIRPPARHSRADHISIALRTGGRVDHDCSVSGECDADVRLPELPRDEGPLGRVVAAVMSVLPRQPKRYQPLISRSTRLEPAVLELNGTCLDVQPLLRDLPAATYELEVREIGGGLEQERVVGTLQVAWVPGGPAAVPAGEVGRGLFRVVVVQPAFSETWVLVQEGPRFGAVRERFAEAARLTESWRVEVGDGPREALLRAYLEYLGQEHP
jgi:hypothetical protein